MKNLGLSLVAVFLGILVGLLGAKVVLSVSTLFGLSFISSLGYLKIYGLTSIIQLLNYKHKVDNTQGESFEETLKNTFSAIFDKSILYLVFWGLSYMIYHLIK